MPECHREVVKVNTLFEVTVAKKTGGTFRCGGDFEVLCECLLVGR